MFASTTGTTSPPWDTSFLSASRRTGGWRAWQSAAAPSAAIWMMGMKEQEGVTEALKAADQMEWVRRMNSIHHRAEEIVLHELVYDA